MTHGFLDSFQLIIAAYLFYIAVRGKGTLYNFPEVPEEKREEVRKKLRIVYAAGGFIALLDGLASVLQNEMFTVTYTETGTEITQNFVIGALPFLSYDLLSAVSVICTVLIVGLLIGLIIFIRNQ